MEELGVDKFSSLIAELEKIIARLEKEIEAKEKVRNNTIRACNDDKDILSDKKNSLTKVTSNLNFLKTFKNKNVFLTANKEIILNLIKQFTTCKPKILPFIILFIMIALSLTSGTFAWCAIAIIVAFQIVLSVMITHDVKKERKLHTVEDLEQEKEKIEEAINLCLARISTAQLDIERLTKIITKLSDERISYVGDLIQVTLARSEAIEGLVSENTLNQAFESFDAKGIMERVRKSKRSDE